MTKDLQDEIWEGNNERGNLRSKQMKTSVEVLFWWNTLDLTERIYTPEEVPWSNASSCIWYCMYGTCG